MWPILGEMWGHSLVTAEDADGKRAFSLSLRLGVWPSESFKCGKPLVLKHPNGVTKMAILMNING